MENIINTILDIDKAASDRLEEAQKNKIQVIADAKAEAEKIVNGSVAEADKKLAQIGADEEDRTAAKIAEINSAAENEIKQMESAFSENHDRWQDEIFKAVIGQ